jgi:hypothetical protein
MLERLRRDQTMITANCSPDTRGRRCVIVYAHRFYFFFTVTVHFGDALVVYLPKTLLNDDHGENSMRIPGLNRA